MTTPSTENYTLGKGQLFWDPWDPDTNQYTGERSLGNAPEVSINMNATFLDHFSSMSDFKAKDKSVVSEIAPQITFTLDELVADNWKLLVYGTQSDVTQSANDHLSQVISTPRKGRYYQLVDGSSNNMRGVGSFIITHGTVTGGPFQVGETVTGGTSKKTCVVVQVVDSTHLIVSTISGTFTADEGLTGGTSGATATMSGSPTFTAGTITVKTTSGSTYYTEGADADYTLNEVNGLLYFPVDSSIVDATSLTVYFAAPAATYTKLTALTSTGLEGKIRYVSDNPVGGQYEMLIWRVRLKPNGDTALIGDDWAKLGFQGDILRDSTYHPTSPYMDMIILDA